MRVGTFCINNTSMECTSNYEMTSTKGLKSYISGSKKQILTIINVIYLQLTCNYVSENITLSLHLCILLKVYYFIQTCESKLLLK